MALIKCIECGHEVSDKAAACMNCGCPVEEILVLIEKQRVINIENYGVLLSCISEEGILRISSFVQIIEHVNWRRLCAEKHFDVIFVPKTVKEIAPLAFKNVPSNVSVYIEHENMEYGMPLVFRPLTTVYVNYKNYRLQEVMSGNGFKYMLFDFNNNEIVPFIERDNESVISNTDEKRLFTPYLTDREKKLYEEQIINGQEVHIPETVMCLYRGDFNWKYIETIYQEKNTDDSFPILINLWIGKNVSYIADDFFYADDENSPIYSRNEGSEDLAVQYRPSDIVHCHCMEESYAGSKLVDLKAKVYLRNEKEYDTKYINGAANELLRVNSTRFECAPWTTHNTQILFQEMINQQIGLDDSGYPTAMVIPDGYDTLDESALTIPWKTLEKVVFPEQMAIDSFSMMQIEHTTIRRIYIPYSCYVDEYAFERISRDITIYCEEGSSAEKAAVYANKQVVYFDFKGNQEYNKGDRKIQILKSSVEDIFTCIKDNPDTFATIFKVLFKNYDVLLLERGTNMEKTSCVLKALKDNHIVYVFS